MNPLRPLVLAAAVVFGSTGTGACAGPDPSRTASAATPPSPPALARPRPSEPVEAPRPGVPKELPRGGRTIFPQHRLVGFCGTPGAPALGLLEGDLSTKTKRMDDFGTQYAHGRTPLAVFELIAVVVQGAPGSDGTYRRRVDDSIVDYYLREARKAKAILLLDLQPGQSDFMSEVTHFEKYLREPDVGIALDPEWAVSPPREIPGKWYGHTTGTVIDDVASYLSTIVAKNDLPEKVLVFHQLATFIVKKEEEVKPHPGVAIVKSVDGLGPKNAKIVTFDALMKTMPKGVHAGFKLFFDEDTRGHQKLMTPGEVMALSPQPEYVMYE